MKEKTRFQKAYKETELEWQQSDLKYKITKYLEGIKITSADQEKFIDNQFIMIEELDPPEINDYLDKIHSIIMENNRAVIDNIK